jgi:hypothetical protein
MDLVGWFDTFRPRENPSNHGYEIDDVNFMFETYGDDLSEIVRVKNNSDGQLIWTLVEFESGEFLIEGFHHVNRIGYFIASVPWSSGLINIPFA